MFNRRNTLKKLGSNNHGFTLIEILIVIGIIAILAGIVLVAINPARQFRQANNAQRESNVNAILNAIGQYSVDNKGDISALAITSSSTRISNSGLSILCSKVLGKYLPGIPSDPESIQKGATITSCTGTFDTAYAVMASTSGRITVSAPLAKIPDTGVASTTLISVTR